MIMKAFFSVFFVFFLLPGIHAGKANENIKCNCLKRPKVLFKEECCPDGVVTAITARCYAQVPVKDGKSVLEGKTHSSSSARQLETNDQGGVLHYELESSTTGLIPRSEVVASVNSALSGGDNFEVEFNVFSKNGKQKSLVVRDLTRNDMQLMEESDNLSGPFSVKNAFVKDEADVLYDVECPAAGLLQSTGKHTKHRHSHRKDTSMCRVKQLDTTGNELVNCWQEESDLSNDMIPPSCLDKVYDVNLMSLQAGLHFFLNAVRKDTDAENQDGCPSNVGIDSLRGIKKKAVVYKNDLKDLSQHMLGSASLGSILKAEEDAEPISESMYDRTKATCAHYAQQIWRSLDIAETDDLAKFIISNLARKGDIDDLKKIRFEYGQGGIRALAALTLGGEEALLRFIHNVVYSELEIEV